VTDRRVRVGAGGLLLGDEQLPVWSAEVHYCRLDPAHWPRILDAVADLGFTCVSSYLPWFVHEQPDRSFDFSGARDVVRFWTLAAERGLKVIARPGPNQGAEYETSGWPRRVLDDPACQARRPDGRPYLLPTATHHAFMPSYASHATLAEIEHWYDVIAPLVAVHQWPDGPIVAAHVDNEMGFHFQSHPFALDYHPDAIAQWHDFVGEAIDPPRDGRDGSLELRLAWIEFREHHLRRSIGTLAEMLRGRGVDRIPLLHNDYPRTTTPFDSRALENSGVVDVATGDVYATRRGGRFVRHYARHLSGTSKLPWLAEAGVGWITLPWLLPMEVDPADGPHNLWRALAGGVRAFNVFMAVERDRWYGAPISASGELREPLASEYRRILATLRSLDWCQLKRSTRVLMLENRDLARREAAHAIGGALVPPFAQVLPLDRRLFDGASAEADAVAEWERDWRKCLDDADVEWDAATTSSMPDMAGYDVVICPRTDLLGEQPASALAKAAADGVRVISSDTDPSTEDLSALAVWRSDAADVDVTHFVGVDGADVLLTVNGTDEPRTVQLRGPQHVEVVLAPWAAETTRVGA
jgi:beta-galactosidase